MLHAAAMLAGLFALGLLLAEGWTSAERAAFAFASALASVALMLPLGGIRKTPFSAAPQFALFVLSRSGAILRGALATMRAAIAADVTLKPALVRVRADARDTLAQAAAADAISAAPGSVVVETDGEGMLVHVLNEDRADSAGFAAIEAAAMRLLGGRR